MPLQHSRCHLVQTHKLVFADTKMALECMSRACNQVLCIICIIKSDRNLRLLGLFSAVIDNYSDQDMDNCASSLQLDVIKLQSRGFASVVGI